MSALLFANARLIDPASRHDAPGDLRVRGGVIAEIAPHIAPEAGERVIDLDGMVLAPALIDARCRVNPASTGAAGIEAAARAAAAGGIGTLILAPDSGAGLSRPEHFAPLEAAALTSPVRLLPAGLAIDSAGEMGEIGLMLRAGAVYVGDGGRPEPDTRLVRRTLSYAGGFDAWTALTCEDAALARNTCAHESDLSMRMGLPARPAAGERLAAERAAVLAELTGARILLDRITTSAALKALDAARARELDMAATVPVTHLMFNELDAGGFDARYRLEPPLRSEADRLALIGALKDGAISAIVSDHRFCTGEAKAHPFPEAEPGSANLEALLPALLTLCAEGRLDLLDALWPVTAGPAELFGLDQGRLAPGAPADLIAFDPDHPVIHTPGARVCAASSAFDNRRLTGKLLLTVVEGAIIHQPES
ncbi:amidohydrolase family protein [Alkalicaulis satelles]|uniref:Amidohydrolase family protein n=1 Tax=Alkalicaulis satelles TaxID=2609175 RepID=A0A5M6ZJ35_9PROT|nr:amidohydrolase family protein [Alkalicaulis satelles]KAA5804823.1 amidohydrolase family protein [Alkalicaulis satelles]